MALSKIDTTNMIEDVPQSKLDNNINFRNIIINGDMSIAQRGTSASGITSSSYNTVDRFQTLLNSLGTWTQSQSTDVPTGQGFAKSLKMDCTTADASPASGDFCIITTKFEGQNVQYLKKGTANAESTTLSFWVKSNKTGTYVCQLQDVDNTRSISKSYTIDSASTWEKKTITFAGDTTGTLDNDNARSFQLYFWLGAGSDYSGGTLNTSWNTEVNANRAVGNVNLADSTSNEWYITGVQLEAGTTASDFEFLPYDVNENRCLRYFRVVGDTVSGSIAFGNGFTGAYNTTTQVIGGRQLPIRMRASPTVTLSALSTFDLEPFDIAPSSLTVQNTSPNEVVLKGTDPSARTKGFVCVISIDTAGGYVRMDAEL